VEFQLVADNLRESFRVIAASRAGGEVLELQGVSIASAGVTFQMFNAAFLSGPVANETELKQRVRLPVAHFDQRGREWAYWVCEDWIEQPARKRSRRWFEHYGLRLSTELPGATFHIVSKDKGFDPLIKHLKIQNITNLPQGACVEVPVYVDTAGFHPLHVGALPPECALLTQLSSGIEEMAITAALNQGQAVGFSFFTDFDDAGGFYDFWDNQPEATLWINPFEGGTWSDATWGGHMITIMGYNEDDPDPTKHYWIVRNQWGLPTNRPNGQIRLPMQMNYGATYQDSMQPVNCYQFETLTLTMTSPASAAPTASIASSTARLAASRERVGYLLDRATAVKAVSDALGTAISSNAVLSMYPNIHTPFSGAVTYWGKDATFSVQAWGTGPLTYQWFKDGTYDKDYLKTHAVGVEAYEAYVMGEEDGLPKTPTPAVVTSSGYYYVDSQIVAKIASMLGKTDDAKKYNDLADAIRLAYNKTLYKGKGIYANGSQTALSCPVYQGLVDPKEKDRVVAELAANVHRSDDHLDAGFLGMKYLLPTLSGNGRHELAFRIATQTTPPSWGDWIKRGATTLWEDWGDGESRNHIMYGDISAWFYKALAGINLDPAMPAFKHIIIKPNLVGGLTSAEASYYSVRGRIVSDWEVEHGHFKLTVTVPANATATVWVPTSDPSSVVEGGRPAVKAEGVMDHRIQAGRAVFEVGSGTYHFTARL